MWDKEGAGAGYCSSVSWRLARGSRWSVDRGASGSFHPFQYEPACTTKLQVTSGHLGQKINSSPCFKIEIKLKLGIKCMYNRMPQGLTHSPLYFFLQDTCQSAPKKINIFIYKSFSVTSLYFDICSTFGP